MKVLFLPVDSRPCNRLFPEQLLQWCGAECIRPPKETMDHFTRPAAWPDVQAFLTEHAAEADVWAISLDQLCFGSLLASREMYISEEEALARLDWFEELRSRYPEKPVHAINTILRTSISALHTSDLSIYRAMYEYSHYSNKAEVTGSLEDLARAERAAQQIPTELIERYHTVRQRNHAVNARGVKMVKRGVLNSLQLLMEDSEIYGFHRTEQRVLQEMIGEDSRVMIKNGTDEGPMLAMKCLSIPPIPVSVQWLGRADGDFIALYEDRPFAENVKAALAYLNIREDPEAEVVLAIAANSEGRQLDPMLVPSVPSWPEDERRAAEQVNALLDAGKKVYLLDLFICNGGWADFMRQIDRPDRLAGYSAWNTASNSLGTIIGQLCSDHAAGKANQAFRNERFLDDLLYEGCIRGQLNHLLHAEGEDPYHIKDMDLAKEMLQELYDQIFSGEGGWTRRFADYTRLMQSEGTYQLSFPWERTFEIETRFSLKE